MMKTRHNIKHSIMAVMIAVAMLFSMIPAATSVSAADSTYTFQPVIPEGVSANSLLMINPSDITVLEENDTYIVNQINSTIDGTKDIVFTCTMSAGMNNFNEAHFLQYNMPIIKILDSNGDVAAQYSSGLGDLQFLGSAKSDQINNQGGKKTIEFYIGVDKDILGTGDYTLVFGKSLCGNNIEKVLGKDIKFNFFVKATSDLDVLIGEVQDYLDSVIIGDEPGQYPQTAADVLADAISTAEDELSIIDTQLAEEMITAEQAVVLKNSAAKTLDSALKVFKASRIVDVKHINISGVATTIYVGDEGSAIASVSTDPDEAAYQKVKWESSDNIKIDEITGEWLALYSGEGWISAVSKKDASKKSKVELQVVNEGDSVGVMLSEASVAPIDAIKAAYDGDVSEITSLKLFTTGSGYLDKSGVAAIHAAIPELKVLNIKNVDMKTISNSCFAGWDKLETIILPDSLTTIDIKAFYNCSALKNADIPVNVTTIGSSAFAGCTALENTITVMAANPPSFATAVFEQLGYGDSFKGCKNDSKASVTAIRVPYGCTADYKATSGWKRYTIEEMDEKVLSVTYNASGGLASAAEKELKAKGWGDDEVTTVKVICSGDAELEKTTDMAYLQTHFLGATVVDLTQARFPDNNIQSNTFKERINVKEIILPEGITHMGRQAFYGCSNLRTMTIPSTVHYLSSSNPGIGESAFGECSKLTVLIMNPAEPPGYAGSMPAGLEVIYVPNLVIDDYKAVFVDQRDIIVKQSSVSTAEQLSVEAMSSVKLAAEIDSVVDIDQLKWEITTKQDPDSPVAVIDEKTGVLTACRYGTVTVRVTAGYGTMNECSDTCKVTVTKAPAVTLTASGYSYNTIKLNWTAMGGAQGYQIFRSDSKDGSYELYKTLGASAKSFDDTGIKTGTTYYYKVRGYKTVNNVKVYGEYSEVKSAVTALGVPASLTAAEKTYNSIYVKWDAVSGATGYKVYRSTVPDGSYSEVASMGASETEYTDQGIATGTVYYYKVCAYRTVNGNTVYGEYSDVKDAKTSLAVPAKVTVSKNTYNSLKVSWKGVAGATGYKIYRSTKKNGTYKLIATKGSKATTHLDKAKVTGTTYYYKVRAYRTVNNAPVYSAYSSVKSAVPTLAKVKNVKTAKAGTRKIKVTWGNVAGATGYKVYRSTKKNSGYKVVKTVKAGKKRVFTSGKLKKNKTYYYKIRAYRNVKVNGVTKTVFGPYSVIVSRKAK